jgi:hypothetical protein
MYLGNTRVMCIILAIQQAQLITFLYSRSLPGKR